MPCPQPFCPSSLPLESFPMHIDMILIVGTVAFFFWQTMSA